MAQSIHFPVLPRHSILLVLIAVVAGCTVPEHMHVTEGTAPQNVDRDVRFRTTYYYRVFDYCWSADFALALGSDGGTAQAVSYRQIIPETDTLYRYRMTGTSSALFNQIKFESGTLKKEQIDPFGTDVTFNPDINGFLVRNEAEAKSEARAIVDARARKSERTAALQRYQALRTLYGQLPQAGADDQAKAARIGKMEAALENAMVQALAVYTGSVPAQLQDDLQRQLKALEPKIQEAVSNQTASGQQPQDEDESKMQLASVEATMARLTTLIENNKPLDALCPPGAIRRKGFQVMGPEGIKEFDQDERLIMAMYTGATPLTETLQEYSGRVLNARANPAEQLLPLVRENLSIVEAKNAAERVETEVAEPAEAAPTADAVFDAALTAFEGR